MRVYIPEDIQGKAVLILVTSHYVYLKGVFAIVRLNVTTV